MLLGPGAVQVSSRSQLALLKVATDRKRSLSVTCDAVAGLLNMSVDVEGKIAVILAGGALGSAAARRGVRHVRSVLPFRF